MSNNQVFVNDISIEELENLLLHNKSFKFGHENCPLLFSSDGRFLYFHDINKEDFDPVSNGDFLEVIHNYYGGFSLIVKLMDDLSQAGFNLYLSDHFDNHSLSLSDLKCKIKGSTMLKDNCFHSIQDNIVLLFNGSKAYIEDTPIKELKSLIVCNKDFKFKHKDCSLFFSADTSYLYLNDIDSEDFDPVENGNFLEAIQSYYGGFSLVVKLMEDLSQVGLDLILSDHFYNYSLSLSDLKTEIRALLTPDNVKELFNFCKESIQEFGAMPMDFEINDLVLQHEDYITFLTDLEHRELSLLIEKHNND